MKPRYAKFTAAIDRLESMQKPLRPGVRVIMDSADAATEDELQALIDARVATTHAERPSYYDPDFSIAVVIVHPPAHPDDPSPKCRSSTAPN
jgi:hypothetical protein